MIIIKNNNDVCSRVHCEIERLDALRTSLEDSIALGHGPLTAKLSHYNWLACATATQSTPFFQPLSPIIPIKQPAI